MRTVKDYFRLRASLDDGEQLQGWQSPRLFASGRVHFFHGSTMDACQKGALVPWSLPWCRSITTCHMIKFLENAFERLPASVQAGVLIGGLILLPLLWWLDFFGLVWWVFRRATKRRD